MKKLEEKVKRYLEERGATVLEDSISYGGFRKGKKLFDGEIKNVHIMDFQLVSENTFEDQICYIYVDAETDRLMYLVTPHFFERIDFE